MASGWSRAHQERLDRLGALLAQEHVAAPWQWEKTGNDYQPIKHATFIVERTYPATPHVP